VLELIEWTTYFKNNVFLKRVEREFQILLDPILFWSVETFQGKKEKHNRRILQVIQQLICLDKFVCGTCITIAVTEMWANDFNVSEQIMYKTFLQGISSFNVTPARPHFSHRYGGCCWKSYSYLWNPPV